MTTVPLLTGLAVLKRMAEGTGGPIATHWLDEAAGAPGDTAKTRRLLVKMRNVGLVEGVEANRSGRVFWWQITTKGRDFMRTFAAA